MYLETTTSSPFDVGLRSADESGLGLSHSVIIEDGEDHRPIDGPLLSRALQDYDSSTVSTVESMRLTEAPL